ncbi:hypothetical protein N483_20755 [Pseudoalteromonas luteoviolacea NCIMB 1944]|nr:hypothetical protein N483_20755 [Pseudoalteromonas luteoviolacea NCIMB 1944]
MPNGFINNTRHELMPTDLQEKYYQQYGDAIEKFSSNLNGIVVGSLTQVAGAGAFSMRWALLYLAAFPEYLARVQKELDEIVWESYLVSILFTLYLLSWHISLNFLYPKVNR